MKKFNKTLLLLLMGVFVLGACSVSDKEHRKDNILEVGVHSLSGVFHPAYSSSVYDAQVNDLIYDSLLEKNETGAYVPRLAKSLPLISDDYKTITFTLRDDAYFANGDKVRVEDVAFSFTMLADAQYDGPHAGIVANIAGYQAYQNKEADHLRGIEVAGQQIIFHFEQGNRDNLDMLANLGISSATQFADYTQGNLEPIKQQLHAPMGSGPYMMEKYDSETGMSLVRNPKDTRKGYAIQNIILKPVNEETKFTMLEKGKIDLLSDVSNPNLVTKGIANDKVNYQSYERSGLHWLSLNCESEVLQDVNVRKAIALAFDREAIIKHEFSTGDDSKVPLAYVPQILQNPVSSLHDYVVGKRQVAGLEADDYDIEKAKQYLDESGWLMQADGKRYKDGKVLSLKILLANKMSTIDTLTSIWHKAYQEQLGIDLKIASLDFNAMLKKISDQNSVHEWDAFVISSTFSGNDLGGVATLFHSRDIGRSNFARLADPQIDALIERAKQTFDKDEMEAIYLELAKAVHDQYAYIPMYGLITYDFYTKELVDFKTSAYRGWTAAMKEAKLK